MLYKATNNSKVVQALTQVFELMDQLGLKIENDCGVVIVHHGGTEYKMLDLEQSISASYSAVHCLPAEVEYKLICEVNDD